MKKTLRLMVAALMVGLLGGPQFTAPLFAAASGNYTDLLPIGAAGNTTVISNGSGWSLTTLPVTQTFGDSLSRIVNAVYQSTNTGTVNATTVVSTLTALSGQGKVGSITIPASWVASGRSIETIIDGTYSTVAGGENWTWALKIGGTTILNTGAVAAAGGQTTQNFKARSIITVGTTGASGTAMGTYEILCSSGASSVGATVISFSTSTNSTSIDWTGTLTVNPTLTWGTGSSSMTVRNASVRLLN